MLTDFEIQDLYVGRGINYREVSYGFPQHQYSD
jgi:hypothetical protein